MSFIDNLNKLSADFDALLKQVDALPRELRDSCQSLLTESRSLIGKALTSIEQQKEGSKAVDNAREDIIRRMSNQSIYNGIPDAKRVLIADAIINSNEKELLDSQGLSKWAVARLRNMDEEALVIKAYGKDGVLKIGKNLVKPGATEQQQYDMGMKAALKSIQSPIGREDAIAHGEKRILSDMKLTQQYLYDYYKIG